MIPPFVCWVILAVLMILALIIIYVAFHHQEAWQSIARRFMRRMSFLIVLIGIAVAQESFPITEDPPLYFIDPPVVDSPDEIQPITFPQAMPEANYILISMSDDLQEGNFTDINWTAFYHDFQPLENNLTA